MSERHRRTAGRRVVIDRFGPPPVVRVERGHHPRPGPGEVLVRVEASTVNGTDVVIRKGLYPLLTEKPPLTLGYDLVGTVTEVGEEVDEGRVGIRVAAVVTTGGNADEAVVPEAAALPVPADADPARLAALTIGYLTAYQMLRHHLEVGAGQRLLVHGGSGAVGTAAIQLARLWGAEVVATASPGKLDHVSDQGAEAVSYRDARLWQVLREAAGDGFHGVLDPVGAGSVGRSLRLVRPGGRVLAYSTVARAMRTPARTPASFLAFGAGFGALQARLAVSRLLPGGRRAEFYGLRDSTRDHPERHRGDLAELCRLLAGGAIAPVLTVLPLDAARHAHERHDAGEVVGQLVLTTS